MISNGFTYKGVVSLKTIDAKSKKIKKQINIYNNGSNTLFFFLCRCLTKRYDEQYAPLAIDASTNTYNSADGEFNTCLSYRVLLSNQGVLNNVTIKNISKNGESIEENNKINYPYVARFSAIIPYSVINLNDNAGVGIRCFQLHSKLSQSDKTSSLLAWINLEEDEAVNVKDDEALLIEWNMGFQNPNKNQ